MQQSEYKNNTFHGSGTWIFKCRAGGAFFGRRLIYFADLVTNRKKCKTHYKLQNFVVLGICVVVLGMYSPINSPPQTQTKVTFSWACHHSTLKKLVPLHVLIEHHICCTMPSSYRHHLIVPCALPPMQVIRRPLPLPHQCHRLMSLAFSTLMSCHTCLSQFQCHRPLVCSLRRD